MLNTLFAFPTQEQAGRETRREQKGKKKEGIFSSLFFPHFPPTGKAVNRPFEGAYEVCFMMVLTFGPFPTQKKTSNETSKE